MIFPNKLILHVVDQQDGKSIYGIAIMLTLFASRKNNYNFPKVTQKDGTAVFTLEEVKKSIEDDQKMFVMDYASSLEECSSEIEVKIISEGEVRGSLAAFERFRKYSSSITGELIKDFRESKNNLYESSVIKILLDEKRNEKFVELKTNKR